MSARLRRVLAFPSRLRARLLFFFFYGAGAHRDLHSFPTRRSSDLAVVDAACAGKADAALGQLCARELVGAGADRLDEAELLGTVENAVMPQPGDHQHIGLAYPLLDRKSTRLNSSHLVISYAVFCLK